MNIAERQIVAAEIIKDNKLIINENYVSVVDRTIFAIYADGKPRAASVDSDIADILNVSTGFYRAILHNYKSKAFRVETWFDTKEIAERALWHLAYKVSRLRRQDN